jgi:hypothetical protein
MVHEVEDCQQWVFSHLHKKTQSQYKDGVFVAAL